METSPLICRGSQQTSFYVIETSVMKELISMYFIWTDLTWLNLNLLKTDLKIHSLYNIQLLSLQINGIWEKLAAEWYLEAFEVSMIELFAKKCND